MNNADHNEIFSKCLANEKLALEVVQNLKPPSIPDPAVVDKAIRDLETIVSGAADLAQKAGSVRKVFSRLTGASHGLSREAFLRRSDLVARSADLLKELADGPSMRLEMVDAIVESQRLLLERIRGPRTEKNRPIIEDDVLSILGIDAENDVRLLSRLSKSQEHGGRATLEE